MATRLWQATVIGAATLLAACGSTAAPSAAPGSSAAQPAPAKTSAAASAPAKPAASGGAALPASKPAASAAAKPAAGAVTSTKPAASGLTRVVASFPEGSAHLPLWYAQDYGIFAKNGIDADLRGLGGGSPAMAALTSGQTQVADITGSVIASVNAAGADIVALATLDPVYPYVLEVDKDIKTTEDLRGKQIAVRSFGDATDVAVRVALQKLNLAPDKDVKIIEVNSEGARVATVLAAKACCTVSQPRERAELESNGFHQLFDFSSLGLKNAQGVISVQRSYAVSNRDTVQRFMNSIVEAIAAEKKDKPRSIASIKKYLKLADGPANTDYDYFVGEVIPSYPEVSADQFTDGIAVLATKNDKLKNFDMSKSIDMSFLERAPKF